jgi:hypothetical protein
MVSGGGLPAYWISHYVGDILFEAPPSICAIIAYILFGLDVIYLKTLLTFNYRFLKVGFCFWFLFFPTQSSCMLFRLCLKKKTLPPLLPEWCTS